MTDIRPRPTRALRAPWLLLGAALLAGCSSFPDANVAAETPELLAAEEDLTGFVKEGWNLPLAVDVFLSNAEDGAPLPPEQAAVEEALALAQLKEVRAAYARAAFDFFRVRIRLGVCDEPSAELDERTLEVRLPTPAPGDDPRPLGADGLLAALAEDFEWDEAGGWYSGQDPDLLLEALRRDLGKVTRLEEELEQECRRLELLAATALARSEDTEGDVILTPSEAVFARAAQFRGTFALHRVLNTMGRWQEAYQDPVFPHRDEALVVLFRARQVHEAYLGWLLTTLVGGRTAVAIWKDSWWSRNPLYKALDASADLSLVELEEGHLPRGELPEGSVRALLAQRLDLELTDFYDDLDDAVAEEGWSPPLDGPLGAEVAAAWAGRERTAQRIEDYSLSTFYAWKELWDARLKNTLKVPYYGLISQISNFLGHTRVSARPPAVTEVQLEELESLLRPGDLILVRQDSFLSNAFLPGFWPHALLYLGPVEEWTALRDEDGEPLGEDPVVRQVLDEYATPDPEDGRPRRCIEAVSAGVVFSSFSHAVRKDYVVLMRPDVSEAERAGAIRRAVTLLGRPYDFDFDFRTDDRVVCTELVYRAYNPQLNFRVAADTPGDDGRVPGVLDVVGRPTMPANEIARYLIYMQDHPLADPALGYPGRCLELLAVFDRQEELGRIYRGEEALGVLREMVER